MFSRFLALALVPLVFTGGCARRSEQSLSDANQLKPIALGVTAFPNDDLGRPVNLKAPAKRVVIIGPGAVETMFQIGAGAQLVGRDDFSNYPAAATKVAVGGTFNGPNVEQCLALRPDLVIVAEETTNVAHFNDWQSKIGVPVASLNGTNFRALAADFRKLGVWVGQPTKAEALAKKFEAPVPSYVVIYRSLIETGDSPGWIAGRNTLVADTARRAGYGNIADELKIDGYKAINVESLLVHPPDVIIVPSSKPKAQVLASLRADAGLSKLPCVQKGHIVVVDGDLLLRPGPRLLQGVEQLQQQNFGK